MRSALLLARSARVRPVARTLTAVRFQTTQMKMPALSPTMSEGGVGAWKKKEGETFEAGDVLVEIETDKASIEIEAQEDGILGRILVDGGSKNVPVGKTIAILAEEGDDLSNLDASEEGGSKSESSAKKDDAEAAEPPKEEKSKEEKSEAEKPTVEEVSAEKPKEEAKAEESTPAEAAEKSAPKESKGHAELDPSLNLFPAAEHLVRENNMSAEQIKSIKGTGKHGKITRGDVLVALGKIKSPHGTAEKYYTDPTGPSGRKKSDGPRPPSDGAKPAKPEPPLDGPALRRLIAAGLGKAAAPRAPVASNPGPLTATDAEYDDIFADYFPSAAPKPAPPPAAESKAPQDELAGLY